MELIERASFLDSLKNIFNKVIEGEGHCVLVSGESGMGKTSLIKEFCRQRKIQSKIFEGTCDALFTPRPLAPLYDIILQLHGDIWTTSESMSDRAILFTRIFHELSNQKEPVILVFEDIHWADEATLDFIKFFARRISRLRCLFLLTYRNDDIHSNHPLRNVIGNLPPDTFTRMVLTPLSKEAVDKLAEERGYRGEDVYKISGGNPFYVNEILASYSPRLPENIRDSILSVFNTLDEKTKQAWEIVSVLPTGFESKNLEIMEPTYPLALKTCFKLRILIEKDGLVFFKHELYRRTIESTLSPLTRIQINKKVLELFLDKFEQAHQLERIIHHAKNANEHELVVKYAPLAARQAALVGAHTEASRLYLSAIEYYQGNDTELLIELYQAYSYECYLTGHMKEAIINGAKSLELLKEKGEKHRLADGMRYLSRFWWFDGNRKKAEYYAQESIDLFEELPDSPEKAMAFSNMSQLKMLSFETMDCIYWGRKAIDMAKKLHNEEILSHALTNVGAIQASISNTHEKGMELLHQSLDLAMRVNCQEHAGRTYTNLTCGAVEMRDYHAAKKYIDEGLSFCEERGLDSWGNFILTYKAKMLLDLGRWDEAYAIADRLVKLEGLTAVVRIGSLIVLATIKMRRGDGDPLPLLHEAKELAFDTMEMQRIIPLTIAFLEYECITGNEYLDQKDLQVCLSMIDKVGNNHKKSEFAYWLQKMRKQTFPLDGFFVGYKMNNRAEAANAAMVWEELKCPYEEAIALFEMGDNEKRKAIAINHSLGANAIYERMKQKMRSSGIKSIPRGVRKSTRSNPAALTEREIDVLHLVKEGMQNKEIAAKLFISSKTVDHHISALLYKLEVNSRAKAVHEAIQLGILK